MFSGWYQVTFVHELGEELTPATIGETPLVLVRTPGGIRAFDAACPHRGAHLAYGGRLAGDAIICPFHGKRIGLGSCAHGLYKVREHPVLSNGGMVFIRLGASPDYGFGAFLDELATSHLFLPGFAHEIDVRADIVIENAFDATHFLPVHKIRNEPRFTVLSDGADRQSPFTVEGIFELPHSPWQRCAPNASSLRVPFVARAFSPHVVVSSLGGTYPYVALTAATPRPGSGCVIRFSLAIPVTANEATPPEKQKQLYLYLLERSRAGIEQDAPIWEHLIELPSATYDVADGTVLAFREFCDSFRKSNEERLLTYDVIRSRKA